MPLNSLVNSILINPTASTLRQCIILFGQSNQGRHMLRWHWTEMSGLVALGRWSYIGMDKIMPSLITRSEAVITVHGLMLCSTLYLTQAPPGFGLSGKFHKNATVTLKCVFHNAHEEKSTTCIYTWVNMQELTRWSSSSIRPAVHLDLPPHSISSSFSILLPQRHFPTI